MNKFNQARFKLAFYYSLILVAVSLFLSCIYYYQTAGVINLHSTRINQRLEQDLPRQMRGPMIHAQVVRSELEAAREQILNQLVLINGFVFLLGAGASYFLSGVTLQPIKQSLEEQKQFVADAAHELKTPLTALKTSLEVSLMDKKLSKKARQVLKDNLADIKSLAALTEGLLSLAKADNKTQQSFSKVSLIKVVKRAVDQVKALADHKLIKLEWKKPNDFKRGQDLVRGDQISLVKVLVILLDNAIKYSPEETTVKVKLEKSGKQFLVKVTDQGPGIPKREQKNIFKRFYQVEQARTKNGQGGYGLGLAVAKKIMEQHQGKIEVKSETGQGSQFQLIFKAL